MPDNKKQHYVPRFYLKKFSINGRSICLWSITQKRKVLSAKLKSQCYKDYFYGRNLVVEKALGSIEGETASLLNLIEKQKSLSLKSKDLQLLIFYISMQHARTAYTVDASNEMIDKLTKHILKQQAKAEGLDLDGVTISYKEPTQNSLASAAQSYNLLIDLKYKIIVNNTSIELVTSDAPVILYNQLFSFRKNICNTGLQAKGLQIFFPISPSHLLFFYDSSCYSVGTKATSSVFITLERDIHELNTLQACSAYKNIYFKDSSFNIESLIKKASPYRRVIKTNIDITPNVTNKDTQSEFIATSREDIRTNLKLSFLKITRNSKKWLNNFKKLKEQPVAVVRNEALSNDHDEFQQKVKKGDFKPSEFRRFIFEKYNISVEE